MHGHLLGPEGAEFAGWPPVGPGALSPAAAVRDHDPRGFLTSLIRITDRTQVFQFGPRDNQALTWFMATDPNAQMLVVPGGWMLPLLHSGMPFDDIRRVFARLQRIEHEHLAVLESIWVRARLHRHALDAFLPDSAAILQDFLRRIDPQCRPVTALPPMRDPAGLNGLLHRLRNAGLPSRLPGSGPGLGLPQGAPLAVGQAAE